MKSRGSNLLINFNTYSLGEKKKEETLKKTDDMHANLNENLDRAWCENSHRYKPCHWPNPDVVELSGKTPLGTDFIVYHRSFHEHKIIFTFPVKINRHEFFSLCDNFPN